MLENTILKGIVYNMDFMKAFNNGIIPSYILELLAKKHFPGNGLIGSRTFCAKEML